MGLSRPLIRRIGVRYRREDIGVYRIDFDGIQARYLCTSRIYTTGYMVGHAGGSVLNYIYLEMRWGVMRLIFHYLAGEDRQILALFMKQRSQTCNVILDKNM